MLVFGRGVSPEILSLFEANLFNADELDSIRLAGLSDPPASNSRSASTPLKHAAVLRLEPSSPASAPAP